MAEIESFPRVKIGSPSDFNAQVEGKHRLIATNKKNSLQSYFLGDFDHVEDARVFAQGYVHPDFTLTLTGRDEVIFYRFATPSEHEPFKTTSAFRFTRTTSVTTLCGQKGRTSFDRRGKY
ncbi:hypothetical protein OIV19_21725 [Brucella sp. HL-2]|nr:hypothetical protein [Brucella sp. HL-2]MCV9910217.1 hypothetical protein [Brucella sp. HL-2]